MLLVFKLCKVFSRCVLILVCCLFELFIQILTTLTVDKDCLGVNGIECRFIVLPKFYLSIEIRIWQILNGVLLTRPLCSR